jgi:hypothetical protein
MQILILIPITIIITWQLNRCVVVQILSSIYIWCRMQLEINNRNFKDLLIVILIYHHLVIIIIRKKEWMIMVIVIIIIIIIIKIIMDIIINIIKIVSYNNKIHIITTIINITTIFKEEEVCYLLMIWINYLYKWWILIIEI